MEIKTIGDRSYYMLPNVPVVKAMVLNGGLLEKDEIKKSVRAWNMKPVVFGHPEEHGVDVSAAKISKIADHIGFMTNSRMEGDRLKSDIFLYKEAIDTSEQGAILLDRIRRGEKIDVSTAYFDKKVDGEGVEDGKEYEYIAEDLAPDHLAILLDEPGACSCRDGCGINVNKQGDNMSDQTLTMEAIGESIAEAVGEAMQEVTTKLDALTTNAAAAAGSAQSLEACAKDIKELKEMFAKKFPSKPSTNADEENADDEDEDEEDYEEMKGKKGKKKMSKNSNQDVTTFSPDYEGDEDQGDESISANSSEEAGLMPSLAEYLEKQA